ncbi:putative integral membrane protein [Alloactinosynnema sp. L-07]|nr:putative integral membrane protein [Alloactinosynnema sp. L-07]
MLTVSMVFYLAATIAVALGLAKWVCEPSAPDLGVTLVVAALLSLGGAVALGAPLTAALVPSGPLYQARQVGVAVLVFLGGSCVLSALDYSDVGERRIRDRALGRTGVALVAGSWFCIFSAFGAMAPVDRSLDARYCAWIAMVIFLGYVGYVTAVAYRFATSHTTRGETFALLVRGLQVVRCGLCVSGLWVALKLVSIVVAVADPNVLVVMEQTAHVVASVALASLVLGGLMISWATDLVLSRHRARTRRALASVLPLWTSLVAAIPEIELNLTDVDVEDVDLLCRRLVEIRDAQIRLRAHVPPWLADSVAAAAQTGNWPTESTRVITEAAELVVALRAIELGLPPARSSAEAVTFAEHETWTFGYQDLFDEAIWLARVRKAMRSKAVTSLAGNASPGSVDQDRGAGRCGVFQVGESEVGYQDAPVTACQAEHRARPGVDADGR